jgi:nicotinic acid mononucleotide adenylyltransferase
MLSPVIVGVYPGSFDPLTVAHLAVAEVAVDHLGLDRLDLAISRTALGKEHLEDDSIDRRVAAIERASASRPWLGVAVVHTRLIAEIAADYDAVVMGADKWAQVNDPVWYGGDVRLRDRAVAALPRVGVAPRGEWPVPERLRLPVPDHLSEVSATAVRQGRHEWAAPEARHPGPDA